MLYFKNLTRILSQCITLGLLFLNDCIKHTLHHSFYISDRSFKIPNTLGQLVNIACDIIVTTFFSTNVNNRVAFYWKKNLRRINSLIITSVSESFTFKFTQNACDASFVPTCDFWNTQFQ